MPEQSDAAHAMSRRKPDVWFNVPQRNPNFTGRDDLLQELRKSMNAVTAVLPQAQTVHGYGGVGKTHLAIEYAWRFASHYDLVAWISADQGRLVPAAMAGLAKDLGLLPSVATGIPATARAVKEALESGEPYKRWLIIYDNAEEPEEVRNHLPRGPGHVLITSRNPQWGDFEKTIRVDVFQRSESVRFLERRLVRPAKKEVADQLATKLGDLPLALEQAGAYQAQTGTTVEEYIELFDEQTTSLLSANRAPGYPQSMTAVWKLSVRGLRAKLPEAMEVLHCCAFFGPEPIPRSVFRRGAGEYAPKLRAILSNPIIRDKIFRELGRFALTRLDTTAGTLQVHRLVQALLKDELSEQDRERYRSEVHLLLAGAAPPDPDDATKWDDYAALFAHVHPSGLEKSLHPRVREFAILMVRYLHRSGNYDDARVLLEELIAEWTNGLGEDHPDVLAAHRHRGNILRALGRYQDAFTSNERAIELMRANLPEDDPELLLTSLLRGADLRSLGDFQGALSLDLGLEEAFTRTFGEGHIHTLRLANSTALDHALTSDYDKARAMHLDTHVRLESMTPVHRAFLLITWNNLARVVRLHGDYAEACDLGEEALAYGMREFTTDHPLTLAAARDLSVARRRLGLLPEAMELAQANLQQFQQLLGDNHPETLAARINVANTLRTVGDLDGAFEMISDVLARYPLAYGADHPFTLACGINLSIVQRLRGEPSTARDYNKNLLAALTRKLGTDHDYTLTCAHNLAGDYAALGDADQAVALGQESYERLKRLFGERHYMTLCCGANLALDLRAAGQEKEASRLSEQVLSLYGDAAGLGHPDAAAAAAGRRIDFDFDPPQI
ncbi:FxSxx-COOH system tetratricopeptide repeat protein [Herbidospora mongoliensis]|uniref:FxSxx-COOH system tetratricopeptide repeat protein n=1 Tax=Herbidospora mongoliensis TaxID=688067 RepID=UPI0008354865|nr:FxSxx-COOH system tetratricopeptide repeat protein [Herbidospora mongoliensis]